MVGVVSVRKLDIDRYGVFFWFRFGFVGMWIFLRVFVVFLFCVLSKGYFFRGYFVFVDFGVVSIGCFLGWKFFK